jgi:hypothetical protein
VKTKTQLVRSLLIGSLFATSPLALSHRTRAADAGSATMPAVIQTGFDLWARGGPAMALDAWQKGGLMQGSRKIGPETDFFQRLVPAAGAFKSYELIEAKPIGRLSQVVYLSMNFERAAVYGRFLLYRTEQDWVVQNMDFSTKPEALIPWLALPGANVQE